MDGLPMESLTKTAIRDGMTQAQWDSLPEPDGHGPWSHTDYLLAANHDLLSWLLYATYHVAGGKPDKPVPVSRPGVTPTRAMVDHKLAISFAYAQYSRDHNGAYPPEGWVPDIEEQ